jgi:hypothetical protein
MPANGGTRHRGGSMRWRKGLSRGAGQQTMQPDGIPAPRLSGGAQCQGHAVTSAVVVNVRRPYHRQDATSTACGSC